MEPRIIAHLDMDAFFASVEERDKPWLKGLPIVVGADPAGGTGRGVVATANYVARAYGIHSALPIQKAWTYSESARREGKPSVAFITPRSRKYGAVSKEVMQFVKEESPLVRQTSVDEAYFDLTHLRTYKEARLCAERLKKRIQTETQLTASIGIGPNKMIAKIASDFQKPNGLTVVTPHRVEHFLQGLSVRSIPGVGPKAEHKLQRLGICTIGQLRELAWEKLEELFGAYGFVLYEKARGIASDVLEDESDDVAKSIGEHDTFAEDTDDLKKVLSKVSAMSKSIVIKMKQKGFAGFRTVVLTVRFEDFETKQRSLTGSSVLKSAQALELRVTKLLLPFFERKENPKGKAVRMIGLRIEKLEQ